jgi:hypothetical protein
VIELEAGSVFVGYAAQQDWLDINQTSFLSIFAVSDSHVFDGERQSTGTKSPAPPAATWLYPRVLSYCLLLPLLPLPDIELRSFIFVSPLKLCSMDLLDNSISGTAPLTL